MHKETVRLDDDLSARLKLAAIAKGTSRAVIVREAIAAYLDRRSGKAKSVGLGRSGQGDVSVRAEQHLAGMGADSRFRVR